MTPCFWGHFGVILQPSYIKVGGLLTRVELPQSNSMRTANVRNYSTSFYTKNKFLFHISMRLIELDYLPASSFANEFLTS